MKIDIYSHILPKRYLSGLRDKLPLGFDSRETMNRANCEIDIRFRLMDRYPDLVQVLTLSLPPVEALVKPRDAIELARIANDELAEMVACYPDRFIAAVACLPLNDMDAALEETDRAIAQLKLRGVQISTNINGEPPDLPKFWPLYEKMVNYDLPIWIHPYTPQEPDEPLFGWPYETASIMRRLVSAGIFKDYPDIKFITHHCGSMVPFFEQRIRWLFPLSSRKRYIRNPVEHFKKFYGDTAVYGSTPALICAYHFFGAEHLLFGTDAPLGPDYGLTRQSIHSVERMEIPDIDKGKIFEQNAMDLLRIAI